MLNASEEEHKIDGSSHKESTQIEIEYYILPLISGKNDLTIMRFDANSI